MYYRRGSLPYILPRLRTKQSASMLSAQQLALYYLYALHDHYCKDVPRLVCGSAVHTITPAGANGHECARVFEWCQHQYHTDPFWADLRIPSLSSFMRLLDAYHIDRSDTWKTVRHKVPFEGHVHMLSVRRHCQDLLDQIRLQIKRYRHNKALEVGTRMKRLNESRQTHSKVTSHAV